MCAYESAEGLRRRASGRLHEDEDGYVGGVGFDSPTRHGNDVHQLLAQDRRVSEWDLHYHHRLNTSSRDEKVRRDGCSRRSNPHVRMESTVTGMQVIAWMLAALKSWFFNEGDQDRQAAVEGGSLRDGKGALQEWSPVHLSVVDHWSGWFANLAAATQGAFVFMRTTIFSIVQPFLPKSIIVPELTLLQQERFSKLVERVAVQFDCSNVDHQASLRALWKVAYPDRALTGLVSEQWKDMGWQGRDPSTDFRGGGFISLENLLYFANQHPRAFVRLFNKETGKRADWEYPFAVAGLNVTFMLVELFNLRSASKVPKTPAALRFLAYLEEDDAAFDELYCLAFQLLDAQWLAMGASYMEFNSVLKATRAHVEQVLSSQKAQRIYDLVEILNLPQQ